MYDVMFKSHYLSIYEIDVLCYIAVYRFGKVIHTHSVTLVEMDSTKQCFLFGKMLAMDGFPTIDTSYTRTAHLPRTAT
ncbi:hypothetical protein SFRURICE_001476 [Spodoptera frugiperda]|nr:hypothetical protein SFRURICE_001476 [Spodoptera frugiperda]